MAHQSSDSAASEESYAPFVSPGMPALPVGGKALSFFEFWPTWLFYVPVILQCLVLGLRYGSFTLPLLANPRLPLSGLAGVPKSALLAQARGACREAILDWFIHRPEGRGLVAEAEAVEAEMAAKGLAYPVVCKPDIGCRGVGVKLIEDRQELLDYLARYPEGAAILVQKLSRWEAEAGIFFVKYPGRGQGEIVSLALKYLPYLVGDGQRTLEQLIDMDARAGRKKSIYLKRHRERLHAVIPKGECVRLIFAASHSRGAIFRNAAQCITPELTRRISAFMEDIPEFYYGRLDVKFENAESLREGRDLEILEINAASAEPLHIWDRKTGLAEALGALLRQYRILFELGHNNRRKGYRPPGLKALLRGWKLERRLSRAYPPAD